jgi:hypothetical protein
MHAESAELITALPPADRDFLAAAGNDTLRPELVMSRSARRPTRATIGTVRLGHANEAAAERAESRRTAGEIFEVLQTFVGRLLNPGYQLPLEQAWDETRRAAQQQLAARQPGTGMLAEVRLHKHYAGEQFNGIRVLGVGVDVNQVYQKSRELPSMSQASPGTTFDSQASHMIWFRREANGRLEEFVITYPGTELVRRGRYLPQYLQKPSK